MFPTSTFHSVWSWGDPVILACQGQGNFGGKRFGKAKSVCHLKKVLQLVILQSEVVTISLLLLQQGKTSRLLGQPPFRAVCLLSLATGQPIDRPDQVPHPDQICLQDGRFVLY